MDFFKSVFSAESDSSNPQKSERSPSKFPKESPKSADQEEPFDQRQDRDQDDQEEVSGQNQDQSPSQGSSSVGLWSFGGLIKTLATKSESVIQTYRRDLEEFSSELKKETAVIREAVKDLPGSLEVGASVAQESLESVGQAIDEIGSSIWRGTSVIISQGKEALLPDKEIDLSDSPNHTSSSVSPLRYSRFEAQVHALQSDLNTYCEEPEDLRDFETWKSEFSLEDKKEETQILRGENGVLEGVYLNLVPAFVTQENFWFRYFYKLYKLKQAEDTRANLVKRVILREDEEELSWEVDDDEESDNVAESQDVELRVSVSEKGKEAQVSVSEMKVNPIEEKSSDNQIAEDDLMGKSDEKFDANLESKGDTGESSKESDLSVVSSQRSSHEEDDLGWDEIEELGSSDEKRVSYGGSPSKLDLRKRLIAAEEDEDLSWDIEDDEPVK